MNEKVPQPSIEELLAKAQAIEAGLSQDRQEKATAQKQAIIDSQVEKIYGDRAKQIESQAQIEAQDKQYSETRNQIWSKRDQLAALAEQKKEIAVKLAEASPATKDIYNQVLEQIALQETGLGEQIKVADEENAARGSTRWQENEKINTSTREAAELMRSKNKSLSLEGEKDIFPDIERYIEEVRKIKAEAKEILAKFDIDKFVEKVWQLIQSETRRNGKTNGNEGYSIALDLKGDSSLTDAKEMYFKNPVVVRTIRDKISEKINALVPAAKSENYRGKNSDLLVKGLQSEVRIYEEKVTPKNQSHLWSGGYQDFGDNFIWFTSEAERMPYLPYSDSFSESQRKLIETATNDSNMPMPELKAGLGLTYYPETVERIRGDAEKENAEVDRKRELARIDARIKKLEEDLVMTQKRLDTFTLQLANAEKNLEYSKLENESVHASNEAGGLQGELQRVERDLLALPKGWLGGVKDKDREKSLQKREAEIQSALPEKIQIAANTKAKFEQMKVDLGQNLMKDYYYADRLVESTKSQLVYLQKDLDRYKQEITELQKKHAELEAKVQTS